MSHFLYLRVFGRFSQSRDQPQPGSFLWSKREDPGNEVGFGVFNYDVIVQIRSFLSFSNFKFNRYRKSFKALLVYCKENSILRMSDSFCTVSMNIELSRDN